MLSIFRTTQYDSDENVIMLSWIFLFGVDDCMKSIAETFFIVILFYYREQFRRTYPVILSTGIFFYDFFLLISVYLSSNSCFYCINFRIHWDVCTFFFTDIVKCGLQKRFDVNNSVSRIDIWCWLLANK